MIEVSHLSKNYGTFRAVNDVSFSIPTGQIVGLLGPNGAGKTSTMRIITGFLKPSEGTISIDGIPIEDDPVSAKRKIGYMPESAPLYSDMIVEDYLRYIATMQGENADKKIPLVCNECGLKEVMHKNIGELSRGYRQRVGLAHALMHDPEILILDEPTSGLDPNQIGDVRNLIKEIGKTRTVIISTHILGEVEMLCSRVIIIANGKLVADSPTEQLRSRYAHKLSVKITVASCSEEELVNEIKKISGVEGVTKIQDDSVQDANAFSLLVSVSGTAEVRPELFKAVVSCGGYLFELALQRNSLEDVFHELTTEVDSVANDNTSVSDVVKSDASTRSEV
ncbi:MAG: ATP-binding cassette domain-containing protein [Treponema sp.]|nr:ATP-binding cassette domain-containing protein [Treponema sp.]